MKLHLGCGSNYIQGWVNIDLDSPGADMHCDFKNPLRFANGSASFIYTEHFIEHITRLEGISFLKECRRVLRADGILRLSTPDLRWLVGQFVSGNVKEWEDVQWLPGSSCELLNEGMRAWGHQYLYDRDQLECSLREVGFLKIKVVNYRQSAYAELRQLECRPWHHEIILEVQ